ncbi:putative hydrolase of the HAD superfamily [Paenibacillus sp. JGP012]|uniref:HAD family hydrolase n=1 Tax=Paenibacillus sp. JGP012 TaxID=2735914 RepID=UPI0017A8AC0E|nr:HAD family hydrolase [Paenibacillus sp. JGP012]MBB6019838.1 putative hydrolase of the HAD superfamily [Paenibacillus sp. JGP012]
MMNTTSAARAIFFDVDDTLYDHLQPLRVVLQEVLGLPETFDYALAYHRFRYYSDWLSAQEDLSAVPEPDAVERMRRRRFELTMEEFGLSLQAAQAQELQKQYLSRQFEITPFEGAYDLIRRLQAEGHTVGLITNGEGQHQRRKLKALDVFSLVDETQIFISGMVGYAKPDGRLFKHVNQQTGTAAHNSYYIGDSWRNDVAGAVDAGWKVIWFNHRGALPESDHEPHFTAQSYEDISRILTFEPAQAYK